MNIIESGPAALDLRDADGRLVAWAYLSPGGGWVVKGYGYPAGHVPARAWAVMALELIAAAELGTPPTSPRPTIPDPPWLPYPRVGAVGVLALGAVCMTAGVLDRYADSLRFDAPSASVAVLLVGLLLAYGAVSTVLPVRVRSRRAATAVAARLGTVRALAAHGALLPGRIFAAGRGASTAADPASRVRRMGRRWPRPARGATTALSVPPAARALFPPARAAGNPRLPQPRPGCVAAG
jgi:hypothetical protein